jgi:hypothetical protein
MLFRESRFDPLSHRIEAADEATRRGGEEDSEGEVRRRSKGLGPCEVTRGERNDDGY